MTNVSRIVGVMHRFNPEGQRIVLDLMRENRPYLDKGLGVFNRFPKIISDSGLLDKIEETIIDKKEDSVFKIFKREAMSFFGITDEAVNNGFESVKDFFVERFLYDISEDIGRDIQVRRQDFLNFFKENSADRKYIQTIENCEDSRELLNAGLEGWYNVQSRLKAGLNNIMRSEKLITLGGRPIPRNKRNSFPLEFLQESYKFRRLSGDLLLEFNKLIEPVSTDVEVLEIENLLKTGYGVEFVRIGDIKDAEWILESVKIAEDKHIPIPKTIMTSHLISSWGDKGMSGVDKNGNTFVLLCPLKYDKLPSSGAVWQGKGISRLYNLFNYMRNVLIGYYQSTHDRHHIPIHEFIHGENFMIGLLNYKYMRISPEQKTIAKRVSRYVKKADDIEELRTELRAKEELSHLNREENRLLDFIKI